MDQLSNALTRLGIAGAADEKSIRAAYARELKLIDQETDIDSFQSLRAAYELAMSGQRAKPAPSPAAEDEAQEALDWIVAAVAVISGGRRIADESIWVVELVEQLAERRPAGIDDDWRFQAAIGTLLLQGWKPGHEALLIGATQYFRWAEEGTWPNDQVAEAWFERFMLHRQNETVRGPLVRVIRDLRQTYEPDLSRLRRDHRYLEHLATHYANLASMIVDARMLERWRELAAPLGTPAIVLSKMPAVRTVPSYEASAPASANEIFRIIILVIFAIYSITDTLFQFS
ncbi:hypothetical protein [Pseudoduganella violaceinigra]|uniref:hypothetical protein n=1 Tax=Pseudoduganella violaceinigra TaxID=246602 RepID=UPI000409EDFC|nr:hypothetical protein [Pseudoduganella violaceinigra]